MKYLFVFLLLGLVSCGDASSNASENVKPKLKEYSWDDLTIPNDTLAFTKTDMKPVTGVVRDRYEDGQLKLELNYKDGKAQGIQRGWYEDGQLCYETNYKDGKDEGLQRGWHENGQLRLEHNCKDGKDEGLQREWYENGQLMGESTCKYGKEDGLFRMWYENGQLKYEINYKNDNVISAKCFDEDGNLTKCD